jgi:hypothetical protein
LGFYYLQVINVKKQATNTARKQQAAATRLNEWRAGDRRREWWRKAELYWEKARWCSCSPEHPGRTRTEIPERWWLVPIWENPG